MPEIPDEMRRLDRPVIPRFDADEDLYRRIQPGSIINGRLALDAIELPDMSVNRGSPGPPEWLLLTEDRFASWGIAKFKVRHIPTPLIHQGVSEFTFKPVHLPEKNNYPHSEVQAFEDDVHIDGKVRLLDMDLHLRWRRRLRMNVQIHRVPG